MLQHYFRLLLALLAIAIGNAANATPADDMMAIQEAKIGIYRLQSEYFIFQGGNSHASNKATLQQVITDSASQLTKVHNTLISAGLSSTSKELQLRHQEMLSVLKGNIAVLVRNEFPENELLARMTRAMQGVVDSLEMARLNLTEKSVYRPLLETVAAHNLAVLMQYIDARYMERGYSITGENSSTMPTKGLDELVREFDGKLTHLMKSQRNNASTRDTLRRAQTKWNFIHGPLTNFNKNSVPFVVHRNGLAIVELLNQAAK